MMIGARGVSACALELSEGLCGFTYLEILRGQDSNHFLY